MCGIAGFFDSSCQTGDDDLFGWTTRMAEQIRHRGPDDGGVWTDAGAGIALASRRLAIVDLSADGHQPMHSASGRFVVVFNGEIYNFQTVRQELQTRAGERPLAFRGHSDTEVLLAAIEAWGLKATLAKCVGMFAFALWDRRERTLQLVRDRIGEKPLYYGWMGSTLLFGSELKALRAHPAFRGEIDRDALALYVRHAYVPSPHSIYRGIHKLSPGCVLTIDAAHPLPDAVPVPYWSARHVAEAGAADPFPAADAAALRDHLDRLLRDAVRQQMIADVPVGAFLSGGIDSSTIVALMQAESTSPVKTFTIGFHEHGYDEAEHAKAVARHLGTDHTELYVTPAEARAVIPRLPTLYDEPFADASQIPTFLVSSLARRTVTVSLSGDGGDELFGGYDRYLRCRRLWRNVGWAPPAMRRTVATVLTAVSTDGWDRLDRSSGLKIAGRARHRAPGHRIHKLASILAMERPEAMYHALESRWQDPAALVVDGHEPSSILTDRDRWANLDDVTHRMMYYDLLTYLPDDVLVKVDRASMGVSLEARAPFLDHRVVEFAWRTPLAMKVRDGRGKVLLRQVLDQYVPRALIERPKMGFGVPIDVWLRGPLREWAEDLLGESRLRREEFFDPAPIRARWTEHLAGDRDWQYPLWAILMFQAWLTDAATLPVPSPVSPRSHSAPREPVLVGRLAAT
jgi:asparagine synthase (glutamine-hydrolysing)